MSFSRAAGGAGASSSAADAVAASSAHLSSLQKLFPDLVEPKFIWYADAPPLMGGKPVRLSVAEFSARVPGFALSENVYKAADFHFESEAFARRSRFEACVVGFLSNLQKFYDKLVVGNTGDLGHGVFARQLIEPGEILGLYAGEMSAKGLSLSSDYGFSLTNKIHELSGVIVDALNVGGVSRFYQHLPKNSAAVAENVIPCLKGNLKLYSAYFHAVISEADFDIAEYIAFFNQIYADLESKGSDFAEVLTKNSNAKDQEWEINSIEGTPAFRCSLAYQNVAQAHMLVGGVPVVVFYAATLIKPGQQLGISYGPGYWASRDEYDLSLFYQSGRVVSRDDYRLSAMPCSFPVLETKRTMVYPVADFLKIKVPNPLKANILARADEVLPFFEVRKQFERFNALPETYRPLAKKNSFTRYLAQIFSKDMIYEIYDRDPEIPYHFDLRCQAKTLEAFLLLKTVLSASVIKGRVLIYPHTLELIIRDISREVELLHAFMLELIQRTRIAPKPLIEPAPR